MKYCVFRDNYWRVHSLHDQGHLFRWRDSTMYNRVYRDSMVFTGYPVTLEPSSSGSWPGTTDQNYFEGLYVKKSCISSEFALFYQNGSRRDTLRNCVVIDSIGRAFQVQAIEKGTTLIDHCTFAGNSRWGVVNFECGIGTFGDGWPAGGRLVFTNNLMIAIRQGGGGSDAGINWEFSSPTNDFTSNNNLYYLPGQASSRAIRYAINTGGATFSAPGTGSLFDLAFGEDRNSIWGDPLLVNATFTGFDGQLQAGSPAIGAGTGGTDIGALGFQGPDTSPPATVSNLRFTTAYDQSAIIDWTAPGDNGFGGTATAYELRYATFPITSANFSTATPASPQPVPIAGGQVQSYVVLGLSRNTTYYVALRAVDDAGNWSGLSNVATAKTTAFDAAAPKAVDDLSTSP